MTMPTDIGVVDLMIGFPKSNASKTYDYLRETTRGDDESTKEFPAGYMFKDVPNKLDEGDDGVDVAVAEMDKWGVDVGMIGAGTETSIRARKDHPGRFVTSLEIDPNDITGAVRKIRQYKDEHDIKAITTFPAGCNPQVPVDDRRYYPIYQTCIDLDIPIVSNAGIAGPRFPSKCQDVMLFDQVCYDFPELRIVMRHGAEPWEELAVKLMLKWPNLYYMPSAFAPKHYPEAIIKFANTRGADKIMYAGYYPMGLSLERIFTEMPNVPFRDHVWPKFLRDNAIRVFKLDARPHSPSASES
jgi:predicted TIM-barrel fold metal-dependent hydrolase